MPKTKKPKSDLKGLASREAGDVGTSWHKRARDHRTQSTKER